MKRGLRSQCPVPVATQSHEPVCEEEDSTAAVAWMLSHMHGGTELSSTRCPLLNYSGTQDLLTLVGGEHGGRKLEEVILRSRVQGS